jgi:hypothetical protein
VRRFFVKNQLSVLLERQLRRAEASALSPPDSTSPTGQCCSAVLCCRLLLTSGCVYVWVAERAECSALRALRDCARSALAVPFAAAGDAANAARLCAALRGRLEQVRSEWV